MVTMNICLLRMVGGPGDQSDLEMDLISAEIYVK